MLHRRLGSCALAALALSLHTVSLTAQVPNVPYWIFNNLSVKDIDASSGCLSNGCPVQQADVDLNGIPQQIWRLVPSGGNGWYNIVNQLSGKVIDVPTPACSGDNGCQVQQWDSNGGSQQQWTLVPTGFGGINSIVNRLSGKALDLPTQCALDNSCNLQQWDSNGGTQQQWGFMLQSIGGPVTHPTPGGITLLVNGSFDDAPDWVNSWDPEYQKIAATFGNQPTAYQWSPNFNVIPPGGYADIWSGGFLLADYINNLNIPGNVPLSIVAHSHGGNVVKIASWYLNHQIDYLVTLGTPQNWDLWEINPFVIGSNYCEVSSLADYKQFGGASWDLQLYPFGYDQYEAGLALYQSGQDLVQGNFEGALYEAGLAALYDADAFYYWMSTKLAAYAWNVTYLDLSHQDLHTADVWDSIAWDCGIH